MRRRTASAARRGRRGARTAAESSSVRRSFPPGGQTSRSRVRRTSS
jgi:hypothetical protein